MPTFYVLFNGLVVDQPDHPKKATRIEVGVPLAVSAATAESAAFHAARVTRGEGVPVVAYDRDGHRVWGVGPATRDIPPPAPPLVEVPTGETTEVFGA